MTTMHRSIQSTVYPNYNGVLKKISEARAASLRSTTSKNAAAQQAQGGATLCTIRFCFGNARVFDLSLWYADKLIAQFNGCASSKSQPYAPMH